MLPRGVKLTADDVFKTVRYVLSVKMLDPSFDNQTKDRLNSRGAVRLVERAVTPGVEAWLSHNPALARQVAEHVISNASSRQRLAQKTERRKSSSLAVLPGKLADCESSDASLTELFLVEGDSAGGSAKQARNKEFQAILPLRGKSLNVWEKSAQEALSNDEISDIAVACGVAPGATDLSPVRYGKICVLADADVDGFHIQCLLLTLFFRHFPELIRQGRVFVAQPPLYRIDADAAGKSRPAQKLYAMDEQERAQLEEKLAKKGYTRVKVGRFKGLGEMNPSELWETTLNPDTRRLLRVDLPEGAQGDAKEVFDHLMGKAHASWRREWMERRGHEISAD
jgi:topoisomerase-4 subunit B